MANSVRAIDFCRIAAMPTSSISASVSCRAACRRSAACPTGAAHSRRRRVPRSHREDVRAAHRALDRLLQRRLMACGVVGERGRARPAVEVFVRASDREVEPQRIGLDRDGSGGMAQVPQDQRTGVVGDLREGRRVGEEAGAVAMAQHDHGGLVTHGIPQRVWVTPTRGRPRSSARARRALRMPSTR